MSILAITRQFTFCLRDTSPLSVSSVLHHLAIRPVIDVLRVTSPEERLQFLHVGFDDFMLTSIPISVFFRLMHENLLGPFLICGHAERFTEERTFEVTFPFIMTIDIFVNFHYHRFCAVSKLSNETISNVFTLGG